MNLTRLIQTFLIKNSDPRLQILFKKKKQKQKINKKT